MSTLNIQEINIYNAMPLGGNINSPEGNPGPRHCEDKDISIFSHKNHHGNKFNHHEHKFDCNKHPRDVGVEKSEKQGKSEKKDDAEDPKKAEDKKDKKSEDTEKKDNNWNQTIKSIMGMLKGLLKPEKQAQAEGEANSAAEANPKSGNDKKSVMDTFINSLKQLLGIDNKADKTAAEQAKSGVNEAGQGKGGADTASKGKEDGNIIMQVLMMLLPLLSQSLGLNTPSSVKIIK